MPEGEAPAVEQDQPTDAPEAPVEDQPQGSEEESFTDSYNPNDVPEEARPMLEAAYKQLQSAYTSKTQTLAQERQEAEQARQILQALANPDTAPEVLKHFGLELAEEDLEEPVFEPDPEERINQLEQQLGAWQEEQAQAATQQAEEDSLVAGIEEMEQKAGREFSDKEIRVLSGRETDPKVLYGLMEEIVNERQKSWIDSKKAPRIPGSGKPGSKAADPSTEAGRLAMAEEAAAMAEASQ